MSRSTFVATLVLLMGFVFTPSHAQTSDAVLLQQFCDAKDIKGAECLNAKQYEFGKICNVKLTPSRYQGKYSSSRSTILVVGYQSDCEAHVNNWGGSIVFEREESAYTFRGYQPGLSLGECTTVSKNPDQDRLICSSGWMGQGHLGSWVSEIFFARGFSKSIKTSSDNLVEGGDDVGAWGANQVDCGSPMEFFGFSKIEPGPIANTVKFSAEYVNRKLIYDACLPSAPPVKAALVKPQAGKAFIAPKDVKTGKFVVDLGTKEVFPEGTFALKLLAISRGDAERKPGLSVLFSKMGRRVALVIGNSRYGAVPPLANPGRDADAVAKTFRDLGFSEIIDVRNASKAELQKALIDFSDRANDADWSVVYYAGHGMEVDGINYLIPVDAVLKRDQHVRLESISLDDVIEAAAGARKLRLVILDACRDNPFVSTMARSASNRSIGRGLGPIEPQKGILIAYSAKHGQVAEDGAGTNSPFVRAFLQYIREPGLDINLLFRKVRDSVLVETNNRQEPFIYGSLPGETLSFQPTN